MPSFGTAIRRYSGNASEMKQMTAFDMECLLKVSKLYLIRLTIILTAWKISMPVFEGLFEEPHNKLIMDLLVVSGTLHALSKLRLHTDATVSSLHLFYNRFANILRKFEAITSRDFCIKETRHKQKKRLNRAAGHVSKANPSQRKNRAIETHRKVAKPFNLNTSKLHAIGDYARTILRFGTTDSYNTAIVSTLWVFKVRTGYLL